MEERNKEYAAQVEKEEEEERRSRGLIPPAKELWDMDGECMVPIVSTSTLHQSQYNSKSHDMLPIVFDSCFSLQFFCFV